MSVAAGLKYAVPTDGAALANFFQEQSPELLLMATEKLGALYDTLVVDEGCRFRPHLVGGPGGAGICPASAGIVLRPPAKPVSHRPALGSRRFQAQPMLLDTNLRNTRPIGELAARWGGCTLPPDYRVQAGEARCC